MARKSAADAAKAKAAKQKKILFVLLGVLLLALVYAYHTMAATGSSTPPPVAASTTTSTTASAPPATPGTTTVASTPPAPSATPSASTPFSPTSTLPAPVLVAAARPQPDSGQLQSFSRFESKDPFSAQGPTASAASGEASSPSGSGSSGPVTRGSTTAPKKTAQPAVPPPVTAVIAVNGVAALVSSGSDFPVSTDPAANGLFHLVALTQKTAKISVVGGSYASGSATLTLKVNQPVTLANTADGKRYTLELFPQGTAAPASSATAGTTTTP